MIAGVAQHEGELFLLIKLFLLGFIALLMEYSVCYVFLIIPMVCIVLIEFYIIFFKFNIARHDKKMRLIRSLELSFFSIFNCLNVDY